MQSGEFLANCSNRLDKVLSKELNVSRNQVEKLIKEGFVQVDGKVVTKPSFKVKVASQVAYEIQEAKEQNYETVDMPIEILYEDDELLVINKPAGLVVHPAPSVKEATLVDWLRQKGVRLSTISGEERNGIVHRLDKETSGAILVAKNNEAHTQLSEQLQNRSMGRYYLAVINYPLKENIVVDKPIARNPKNRLKMAIVAGGREAKSAFAKIATAKVKSELIACKLYSGRTHQIRVHLNAIGRYILGDRLYGEGYKKGVSRVFLHAYLLYFMHPKTKEIIEVRAPLFEDMEHYLEKNFDKGKEYGTLSNEHIKELFQTFTA